MNIFAVVGVFAGVAEDVRLVIDQGEAETERKKLLESYGIKGTDLGDSEHDLKVFEVTPELLSSKLKKALEVADLSKQTVADIKLLQKMITDGADWQDLQDKADAILRALEE